MKDIMPNLPRIILQNILNVEEGIIVQQVNCKYQMGAGLAEEIASKWSIVREEYLAKPDWQLGDVQFVKVAPNLTVANVAGQKYYNRNFRQTNFEALSWGLAQVNTYATENDLSVYAPYGLGSGLAGGKTAAEKQQTWLIVQNILMSTIDLPIITLKPNSELVISGKPIPIEPSHIPTVAARGSGRRCHLTKTSRPTQIYDLLEGQLAIAQVGKLQTIVRIGVEYEITTSMLKDENYQRVWAEMEKADSQDLLTLKSDQLWGLFIEPLGNYINGRIVPFSPLDSIGEDVALLSA
ncbi:hypothetical protein FD723_40200 (plasmid) [Nostoc sp. C052]|uniref:hypothetical protein n=1 Tax=Nostoc sp. C052 TaxID=2576902 RepID=UPI0015C3C3F6|nr:hypothetical protein [Nostoc sp. C052]QLE46436.1 hypothetical protein FD723_40200 [Nostoc sp. C052]